jgi:hypothetical protein
MSVVKIRAALELALDAMVGLIPAATILTSNTSGVFTTSGNHNLVTGLNVKIKNHTGSTPNINGDYLVTVLSPTTFSLQDQITKATIALSVGGIGGTVKANLTAWENTSFQTTPGIPHQEVYLMAGTPENPVYGDPFHREIGYLQVNLCYPLQFGTAAVMTRAELIKSTFPRGSSFTNGGITVTIDRTPAIGTPIVTSNGDRYQVPVKIFYYSNIFSN